MQEDNKQGPRTFEFMGILWSIWLFRNKDMFVPKDFIKSYEAFIIFNKWKERWNICHDRTLIENE